MLGMDVATSLIPMIVLGFSLGLMHALDADHVMAVSVLSTSKPSLFRTLRFCANWALGHGGVLLISGALLFGLGLTIPEQLQQLAESSVGLLLIFLGLLCFWRFRQQRLRLVEHRHGEVVHSHWHIEGDVTQKGHLHNDGKEQGKHQKSEGHAPVMVGVLHGLAGSAPALALIPAIAQGQLVTAMVYLAVFSLGVMLSMLVFGLGFGVVQQQLQQKYLKVFEWNRHLIAASSVVIGSYWLSQTV